MGCFRRVLPPAPTTLHAAHTQHTPLPPSRRKNYYEKYGRNATGLEAFVADQLQAWRACLEGRTLHGRDGRGPPEGAPRTAEDCYLRFESLGMKEELTFYHNDQVRF